MANKLSSIDRITECRHYQGWKLRIEQLQHLIWHKCSILSLIWLLQRKKHGRRSHDFYFLERKNLPTAISNIFSNGSSLEVNLRHSRHWVSLWMKLFIVKYRRIFLNCIPFLSNRSSISWSIITEIIYLVITNDKTIFDAETSRLWHDLPKIQISIKFRIFENSLAFMLRKRLRWRWLICDRNSRRDGKNSTWTMY